MFKIYHSNDLDILAKIGLHITQTQPLLDKYGNVVYSNTLRRGVDYFGYMGSVTTNHIIIYNTPCC